MTPASTRFVGGRIVDPVAGTVASAELAVRDDVIAADADPQAERIDAAGLLIAPGLIDLGVFRTDKPAFRFGGITRAGLMPDQSPVLDNPGLVQRAARAGKPDFWVHPIAAATRGLAGEELAEMAMCQAAGARAVATGRHWIADSGVMARVLSYASALGLTVIAHAEDDGLAGRAAATNGETAMRLGLPSAPAVAEAMAVARDLALARETGASIHFRILSTGAALDLVRAAKAEGLRVTCGTTPAYLFLNDMAVSDFRTFARLSPPLRSEADRQATLAAVADGTIDILCSSHDPRGPEDKRLPFADALPGMAGAETLLAMALGLVRDGVADLPRVIAMMTVNPAKLLGLDAGVLIPGAPADLILIDPEAPWQVDSRKMAAEAGNTPFHGLPMQGRVRRLMKGGLFY